MEEEVKWMENEKVEEEEYSWVKDTRFEWSRYPVIPDKGEVSYVRKLNDGRFEIRLPENLRGRYLYANYLHEGAHIVLGSFNAKFDELVSNEYEREVLNVLEDARIDGILSTHFFGYKMMMEEEIKEAEEMLRNEAIRFMPVEQRLLLELWYLCYRVKVKHSTKVLKMEKELCIDFSEDEIKRIKDIMKDVKSNFNVRDAFKEIMELIYDKIENDNMPQSQGGEGKSDEDGDEEKQITLMAFGSGGEGEDSDDEDGNNEGEGKDSEDEDEQEGNGDGEGDEEDESEEDVINQVRKFVEDMTDVSNKALQSYPQYVDPSARDVIRDLYGLATDRTVKLRRRTVNSVDDSLRKKVEEIYRRIRGRVEMEYKRKQKKGKIHSRYVYKPVVGKMVGFDYQDIFRRRVKQSGIAVIILLDKSGSMQGHSIQKAREFAYALSGAREKWFIAYDAFVKYEGDDIYKLLRIEASGGTDYTEPYKRAYEKWKEFRNKGYDVVVVNITDGIADRNLGLWELANKMDLFFIHINGNENIHNAPHYFSAYSWDIKSLEKAFIKSYEEAIYKIIKKRYVGR